MVWQVGFCYAFFQRLIESVYGDNINYIADFLAT